VTTDPESEARSGALRAALLPIVEQYRRFRRSDPRIVDWTRENVAAAFPELSVLTRSPEEADIVVCASHEQFDDCLPQARTAAVLLIRDATHAYRASVEWKTVPAGSELSFSIIVTSFNAGELTVRCLESIRETLPVSFRGDVLVIDDASRADEVSPIERYCSDHPLFAWMANENNLGYLRSCNRAAERATGDIIVLLNNDTILQPGWIEALTRAFLRNPDAGAIGGKLLYPDGTLQEAGAVLFSDGAGWNVGRGDRDADHPLYGFTRETDYCSGAFLATPREVWRLVGGYDPRYAPMYYEDSDYCLSVRKAGYRVLYEPRAKVVHIQGATSGRDPDVGLKQFQERNRSRFVEKWAVELSEREGPPARLDDALLHRVLFDPAAPRILVIAHDFPEHDKEGGSKGIFDIVSLLREEGWNVIYAVPAAKAAERYAAELEERGVAVFPRFAEAARAGTYATELERLMVNGAFDVVLIFFWHLAHEWAAEIRRLSPRSRVVIHSIDLHFLREARRVLRARSADDDPLLEEVYGRETRLELNAYARADRVIAVSDKEAALVDDLLGRPGFSRVVPVMEDVERSDVSFERRRGILFLASFRHPPNIEAAEYLFREIVPRLGPELLREHPLIVIGTDLDDRIREMARGMEGIELVGWVPSIYPWFERARVSVLPLLHGAGTKNKLVQACMIGTPSVCTSIAVEGLELRNEHDVLVADDADDFASAIRRLIDSEELWDQLAANGRARIEEFHSPAATRKHLLDALSWPRE
jgi:GT2 family glycosyltransferase/glycosyltransferase involved in cell wall biosynthesis